MGNIHWSFRLTIGIVLAVFIIVFTFIEAGRYFDFVQSCHCGSQAVYYADRSGYVVGEMIPAAILGAVIIAVTIGYPVVGVLILGILFGFTGLVKIRDGASSGGYGVSAEMVSYYEYLRMLGTARLLIGVVCGIVAILAGIGLFIMGSGQRESADKGQIT